MRRLRGRRAPQCPTRPVSLPPLVEGAVSACTGLRASAFLVLRGGQYRCRSSLLLSSSGVSVRRSCPLLPDKARSVRLIGRFSPIPPRSTLYRPCAHFNSFGFARVRGQRRGGPAWIRSSVSTTLFRRPGSIFSSHQVRPASR